MHGGARVDGGRVERAADHPSELPVWIDAGAEQVPARREDEIALDLPPRVVERVPRGPHVGARAGDLVHAGGRVVRD